MPTLAERILAIEAALARAKVPHAFGGALALAYYAEPRATIDIDLNVFVPAAHVDAVAAPLRRLGVVIDDDAVAVARRDGQVRVWWDATPVDVFFAYDRFHDAAREAVTRVPFGDGTIPVLAAVHLVVCKAIFDRPKDWIDIEAILGDGTAIDIAEAMRWVGRIAGDDDPRYDRLAALLTR